MSLDLSAMFAEGVLLLGQIAAALLVLAVALGMLYSMVLSALHYTGIRKVECKTSRCQRHTWDAHKGYATSHSGECAIVSGGTFFNVIASLIVLAIALGYVKVYLL